MSIKIDQALVSRFLQAPLILPGTEKVINGDFSSGTGWTLGDGWSIGASEAYTIDPPPPSEISQSLTLTGLSRVVVGFDVTEVITGDVSLKLGTTTALTKDAVGSYAVQIPVTGSTLAVVGSGDFMGAVDNVTVTEALAVAYENQPYTPTVGRPYAELRILPNDITPVSLAHSDETDGVFRVILRYPVEKGDFPAKTMADRIFAAFPIGARLAYSGQTVTITSQQRQPGVAEEGWYVLVLTMAYKAFLTRGVLS